MRMSQRTYSGLGQAFPSFSDIKQGDSGRNRAQNRVLARDFTSSL
jgi:hypothetical protein